MCDHKKNYIAYTGTVSWPGYDIHVQACCTQAGPAHAAGREGDIDR